MSKKFATAGRGIVVSFKPDTCGNPPRRQGHPLTGVATGLAFTAGSLVLVALGVVQGYESLTFSFGTAEVDGQVVSWEKSIGSKGAVLWHPVVRYIVDGKEFTVTGKVGGPMPDYADGETARVLYHPDRPERAQINDFSERWFGVLLACGFGLLGTTLSGVLTWRSFQAWRQSTPNSAIAAAS